MAIEIPDRRSGILALLLEPWCSERGVIRSRLSTKQCQERLAKASDPWWRLFGGRDVSAWTFGQGGTLRKRIGYRNSGQTILRYRLESSGTGTCVEYRTGMSYFARGFSLVWLGMVALFGIGGTTGAVTTSSSGAWVFATFPLVMAVLMLALVAFGRWLARGEAAYLVDVLARAVEGEVTER